MLKVYGPSIVQDMQAVVARGHELNIWDDVWLPGTILSRSGLTMRWESEGLP